MWLAWRVERFSTSEANVEGVAPYGKAPHYYSTSEKRVHANPSKAEIRDRADYDFLFLQQDKMDLPGLSSCNTIKLRSWDFEEYPTWQRSPSVTGNLNPDSTHAMGMRFSAYAKYRITLQALEGTKKVVF